MSREQWFKQYERETAEREFLEEERRHKARNAQVTQPRFVICGESTAPRDGFRLYDCWVRGSEGSTLHQVWAHDANEARAFLLPYGGRGLTDVEEAGR